MVNTRTNVPVLDEMLRVIVLQVIQEANVPVNTTLTTLQTNMTTLTDRIEALMLFQTYAIGELTRLSNSKGTSNRGNGYGRLTKLDFPRFNREDVNGWLVSMHLYDKALEWHKQFLKIHGENVLWPDYEKEILARFSNVFEDPMVELKNLKQECEVQVYQDQIEVLLNRLDLTESYAVSLFIGGLKSEISMPVRMFKPSTLKDAFCLEKMQEATLALTKTKTISQYVGARTNSHVYANRYVAPTANVNKPVLALPSSSAETVGKVVKSGFRKQLSQKELEEKRAKGLCFYCDQKYDPGHKCPGQLYSLEVCMDDIDEVEETYQTMRVRGYVGKHPLHILIDCGSTHNFLDVSAAKKLPWYEYEADRMLILLGGCDMVLGIQWLATLGDINCNFKNWIMKFNYQVETSLVVLYDSLCLSSSIDAYAMRHRWKTHDHAINLLPNTLLVTVRPYKLPPNQKDVVEQMVKELLAARVIKESQSPFSSPIVMVFQPFLRKFVLGFFDDILIYSANQTKHLHHLQAVLEVMRTYTLYAKQSKCTFLAPQVEYLGHVLSSKGVATDPLKIQAMAAWPIPQTIKQLRGFLGLTGYYMRFIKNYVVISQPLTKLLKKNGFHWFEAAEIAFNQLKQAMMTSPVLALPNFEKEFVVETYAFGTGIGAVLHQDGHPIAYLSKALAPRHQALFTYEKDFLAVIMALDRWKGYLLDRHFKIKTDHFSLKYLLDQRLTTPFQTKWLPKLLGFDYEISYKKGSENGAAELNTTIATTVTTDLLKRIQNSWTQDQTLHSLIQKFQVNPNTPSKFTWQANQLTRKGKLVVGDVPELKDYLFTYVHATSIGGHSRVTVTLHNLKAMVYWKGMRKWVKNKVRSCDVCQRNKPDLSAYPGYLQPLPIPPTTWSSISMDFIEGLPSSQGKTVIFVVVDRLNKYAHFMPLHHPFTASIVSQVFMDNVFKLHGLPHFIISDRDKVFLSQFWKSLFKVLKVNLQMSTAYHPQSDGQTEYNINIHTFINLTPFEAIYGQPPPTYVPYETGDSPVEAVDRSLQAREQSIQTLKFHLQRAQDRMRNLANKHRTDREFAVGVWVYVKLQPHRQVTMRKTAYNKLSSKYYGPFQIVKRIGQVAYELALPATSQIHNVFHVSQLKKCTHSVTASGLLPTINSDGLLVKTPIAILDRKLGKVKNSPVMYVLVQWSGDSIENATREIYGDLIT
ncbi:retrotransposon-related protein [Tanacetum coccineum]